MHLNTLPVVTVVVTHLRDTDIKCIDCKDYDLCTKCISKRVWVHSPVHNFMQIPALGQSQLSSALDENTNEIGEWID